ncbi:MAG: hypothetical protein AB1730_25565 [Myxococcota bacterium]|jgi:hypothetical protein
MPPGVKMACSKPAYRKAVQSREKANLALENGVFTYRLDAAHAGTAIAAEQVLEAALDR